MIADAMLDHKKNEYAFGMTCSLEYDLRSQLPYLLGVLRLYSH